MHGKMAHREVYLRYRHKILRRIQNPEVLTPFNKPKRRMIGT